MMLDELHIRYYNIYGFKIKLISNNIEISQRILNDFSHFETQEKNLHMCEIRSLYSQVPWNRMPRNKQLKIFKNNIVKEFNQHRFINYNNDLLSIYNFKQEKGELISLNLNLLHEITYLLILSRSGKYLDLNGLHKIHAFGVSFSKLNLIGIMPSGQGKSTLCLSLLKNIDLEFISDDTPLVSKNGTIQSFPIRIGITEEFKINHNITDYAYKIERRKHGTKYLLPINIFKNKILADNKKNVLFIASRKKNNKCKISKSHKIMLIWPIILNMVIGLGLPIIFEYFWETGIIDFFRKSKIALLRMRSAFSLLIKSDCFTIELGENIEYNQVKIYEYFKQYK